MPRETVAQLKKRIADLEERVAEFERRERYFLGVELDAKYLRARLRAYEETLVLAGPTLNYAVQDADPVKIPTPETLSRILEQVYFTRWRPSSERPDDLDDPTFWLTNGAGEDAIQGPRHEIPLFKYWARVLPPLPPKSTNG